MTTLLFLGAGSSQPFGIPTMSEMVFKFEDYLIKNNIPERFLYLQIKEGLGKEYELTKIDIESIFSVIDGIASEITPKQMGAFPYYYIQRFSAENRFSVDEIAASKKLKEILQIFIQNVCNVSSEDSERIKAYENSYDPLFANIQDIKKIMGSDGIQFNTNWKCFTTNYDTVFDDYILESSSEINDFFEITQSQLPQFNSKKELKAESFVKIHGGLDWWKLKDGRILKSRTKPFTRTEKDGIAMLYPIQQKDLYLHPWITLFQELKKGLEICRFWYFVGYAFNDPYTFEIIKEAFSTDKQMIIINPEAKELRNKFPENMRERIKTFSGRFGDDYFRHDFQDFSRNVRTLEIKIETESKNIEIRFSLPTNATKFIKNEGFDDGVSQISYGAGFTGYGFFSDSTNNKRTLFQIELNLINNLQDDLGITILTSDNKPTFVNLYNQNRDVFGFTTIPLPSLNDKKEFESKNIVPNQRFALR